MKQTVIFILLIGTLFSACKKEEAPYEEDFFFLKSKGAQMPIWVRGNIASDKIILLLHGGPEGGSSQYYTIFPSHEILEQHYGIVYWDQRMCGMSQGNPSMKDATLQQFTDDLDAVVTLLEQKFPSAKIYLMGHSWGGALGTNYLLQHQEKIAGWIEIDGGHSWTSANALSRENMVNYASTKITSNDNREFWEFAIDWYEKHPLVSINDNAHYSFIGASNGYDFNPESDSLPIPFTELLFSSPISTAYFFVPYHFEFLNEGLDLQHRLGEITIPTLLCWGAHDGVFPVQQAYDTYADLGTPPANKQLVIFNYSAHSPNYEEPTKFANVVIEFIEN